MAAVLAFQRAHGRELTAPEPTARQRTQALDLGMDHALAKSRDANLEQSRARCRASLRRLLAESVELGLDHLSQGIHERYSTLAVWAQGAEYHRLALLTRRIADHVEMLLDRAAGADALRLLDEITLALALVCALDAAAARGAAPSPWAGLAAPAQATGRRVMLQGAQVNEAGRLSAADSATATVLPLPPPPWCSS